jgi:hypothetical protein
MRVLGPSCALAGNVTTSLGHCGVQSARPTPRRSSAGSASAPPRTHVSQHALRGSPAAARGVSLRRTMPTGTNTNRSVTLVRVRRPPLSVGSSRIPCTCNPEHCPFFFFSSSLASTRPTRIHAAAIRCIVRRCGGPSRCEERPQAAPERICIPHQPSEPRRDGRRTLHTSGDRAPVLLLAVVTAVLRMPTHGRAISCTPQPPSPIPTERAIAVAVPSHSPITSCPSPA